MADAGRRVWLWGPVVLYCALIFGLSSISQPPAFPSGVSDKFLHGVLYFGLGMVLARAWSRGFRRRLTRPLALLVIVTAALYGVSDEVHQSFVPPRQVEALDVVADTIGAGIAAFGVYAWGIIRPRHGL